MKTTQLNKYGGKMKSDSYGIAKFARSWLIVGALLIGPVLNVHAEVITWIAGGNTMTTPANWLTSSGTSTIAPTSSDLLVFSNTSTVIASPRNNTPVYGGAILLTGTLDQTIRPYSEVGTKSLTLYGYNTTLDGKEMNLLLGNMSPTSKTLYVTDRTTYQMAVYLAGSGDVYASGSSTINFATNIYDATGVSAGITKTGSGLLVLGGTFGTVYSGSNTYSGGFTLKEGTVLLTSNGTVTGGTLMNSNFGTGVLKLLGGTLTTDTTVNRAVYNAVELNGNVTLGGDGRTYRDLSFANNATGKVTTLTGNSTLEVRNRTVWDQNITGDYNLTKTGEGTLAYRNGSKSYTGNTTVAAGSLVIEKTGRLLYSNVEVLSGARLAGLGSIDSATVIRSGGTLSPGYYDTAGPSTVNIRGTLSLYDDLTMEAGSNIIFRLNSATSYDNLYAEGGLSLGGSILDIVLNYQPLEDTTFLLLNNQGFDSLSGLVYNGRTLSNGDVFAVTSGTYAQLFQIDYDYSNGSTINNSLAIVAVPEPAYFGLVAGGLGMLLAFRRSFRRRL